jgi:hypothetical protein
MIINEIRVYSEVYEQGLDIKDYILNINKDFTVKNIYSKKNRNKFNASVSIIDKIRSIKDIDILVTFVCENSEYPIALIEYSTAVPTDDHKMQRSDVYFWGSIFKVPNLKISPRKKGMKLKFGGGSKLNDKIEKYIAIKNDSVFLPINWESDEQNILITNKEKPSCIEKNLEIKNFFVNAIDKFVVSTSFKSYYEKIKNFYKEQMADILSYYEINNSNIIVNSSRFRIENKKILTKVNRFGHAMDPERGILHFINMMVGSERTITEIQVNRSKDLNARNSYQSLFDGISKKEFLIDYVVNIIENKNNIMNVEEALFIFKESLNLTKNLIIDCINGEYFISDINLTAFFKSDSGNAAKSIFYLSQELRLTDINRTPIVTIKWNKKPINDFINNLQSYNFKVTELEVIDSKSLNEDLITFLSLKLLRSLNFSIHSVSYPGAQGDKAILTGKGRKVLRTYVDLISSKKINNEFSIHLLENKDRAYKSNIDIAKILRFNEDIELKKSLQNLLKKQINDITFSNVYTSIGSNKSEIDLNTYIDYYLLFNLIEDFKDEIEVNYEILLLSNRAKNFFSKSVLRGIIKIDKIFKVII